MSVALTYIIAEAGVNHNGSLERAEQLIDIAAQTGADAVKFQSFKTERIIRPDAPKAGYQLRLNGAKESQYEMLKKLELEEEAHRKLFARCKKRSIQFLSSPFDHESVELLSKLGVPLIKIPSGEITNGPLLLKIAETGKPVILSTGMSTLEEIEQALGVLAFGWLISGEEPSLNAFRQAFETEQGRRIIEEKVTLLHCTTEYPAPFDEVNLFAMDTLRETFGLKVGYSDHTAGFAVPVAAVARGAVVIEKHFTLDKNLPGPDHKASLDPEEFTAMVLAIRQAENALGTSFKKPTASEVKNIDIVRKSLIALRPIPEGDPFTAVNLGVKRPGGGISPMFYWDRLGKSATKNYRMEENIHD